MSQFTDYAENKFADFIRGQGWTLPGTVYAALASVASDSSITEITGTSYARQPLTRALATWAGTQAVGSTAASSGTTHMTSNNATINFGTAGSAWGAVNAVVIYDAITSGNPIAVFPLAVTLTINNGDPVSFAAASVAFTLGQAGGMTDYLANKMIDFIFRGQAYTWPATIYVALFTAAPNNAGGGTEVTGGSYARVALVPSLANISGTQGAGTVVASTGTGGKVSNNGTLTFPAPSANWGTVTAAGEYDASTVGNLLFYVSALVGGLTKTVLSGTTPPFFSPATRSWTIQ
jgi:hypothetical protein